MHNRQHPGRNAVKAVKALLLLLALTTATAQAQQRWPLWQAYTARYLDNHGRVIDHSRAELTTSEGQAYALFFSLVQNDRVRFDQLLRWTQENLAAGDLSAHLPGWSWGHAPDGTWKVLDTHSSSDADLWIAYSLLEAGRLWHNDRYTSLGNSLAARIAREEVVTIPNLGLTLLAGNYGFHPDTNTFILNPSYLPPPPLLRLACLDPSGPWNAVLASLHPLLHAAGAGFAMDWLTVTTQGSQIQLTAGSKDHPPPGGSYDAIRVYLWLGIANPATPNLHQLLSDVAGMAAYLKTQPQPPERVDPSGTVLPNAGPAGFSAALVPYLLAIGDRQQAQTQLDRVLATTNPVSGAIGDAGYYDQNLALFAFGWYEHRYTFDAQGRLNPYWQ